MTSSSEAAVNEIIRNLNRIPKKVTSDIMTKEILKHVQEELKKQNKRYNSYV